MKICYIIWSSSLLLVMSCLFASCSKISDNIVINNDILPNDISSQPDKLMRKDSLYLLNQDSLMLPFLSYCAGNKQCLPVIEIHMSTPPVSSAPGAIISWEVPFGMDHHYYLEISGATYDDEVILGTGFKFLPISGDAYKLKYKIRCTSTSLCEHCYSSGAFVKKSNEDDGTVGDFTDCQKEYLSYHFETSIYLSNVVTVVCGSPQWMQDDEDNYLKVDSYKIFKTDYGQLPQLVQSGAVVPGVTEIYLPHDPVQYYQIRLYGSDCEYNQEHYLYKSYRGGAPGPYIIDQYNCQIINGHPSTL